MTEINLKTSGCRELTAAETELLEAIRAQGVALGGLVEKLRAAPDVDQVWLDFGIGDLNTGLSAIARAVERPTHNW